MPGLSSHHTSPPPQCIGSLPWQPTLYIETRSCIPLQTLLLLRVGAAGPFLQARRSLNCQRWSEFSPSPCTLNCIAGASVSYTKFLEMVSQTGLALFIRCALVRVGCVSWSMLVLFWVLHILHITLLPDLPLRRGPLRCVPGPRAGSVTCVTDTRL